MPWFQKKERRMQVSDFPAIFKADFGLFRHISAVFWPVSAESAVSTAGRYDPIWPIRLDFGRISPVRRESKPIRHESSRIGANRTESVRIREKKKKMQTRCDTRATASDAASVLSRRGFNSGGITFSWGLGIFLIRCTNLRTTIYMYIKNRAAHYPSL